MKLSATQDTALRTLVAKFDEKNAANMARWGQEITRINACDALDSYDYRTLFALERAGYITVECVRGESEHLRRGSYGRWIGGTVKTPHVNHIVRITDAGRDYVKGKAA